MWARHVFVVFSTWTIISRTSHISSHFARLPDPALWPRWSQRPIRLADLAIPCIWFFFKDGNLLILTLSLVFLFFLFLIYLSLGSRPCPVSMWDLPWHLRKNSKKILPSLLNHSRWNIWARKDVTYNEPCLPLHRTAQKLHLEIRFPQSCLPGLHILHQRKFFLTASASQLQPRPFSKNCSCC